MSDPIPPEAIEAQRRLEERRREVSITAKAPELVAEESVAQITAPLQRLMEKAKAKGPADQARIDQRESIRMAEMLEHAHCPKRHLQATDLDRSGAWGATETKLVSRMGSGFLIALVGTRGSGKTQLAVEVIRRNTAANRRSRYCSAIEFFMDIKSNYKSDAAGSEKQVIEAYSKPALLVMDEVGKRGDTEWENRLLYELINRRYNAMSDTLIISNQEVSELEGALGPSIVSRMREVGGVVECNWDSYRK